MQQNLFERLLLRFAGRRFIRNGFAEIGVGIAPDHSNEPGVFCHPGTNQLVAILKQYGVEAIGMLANPGQPLQPEPIGQQQVIERAMQAAEENAYRTTIFSSESSTAAA